MPCIPVFEDNQGAVLLAQNPFTISNSKRLDVRHHFLRELSGERDIDYPCTIPFSACGFPDHSDIAGVLRVSASLAINLS